MRHDLHPGARGQVGRASRSSGLTAALVAVTPASWRRPRRPRVPDAAALDADDHLLQRLLVARMSLERGEVDRALAALDDAIASVSTAVTGLLDGGVPAPRRSATPREAGARERT